VGARTASFLDPYADAPETTGTLYWTLEDVETRVRQADSAGLQVSFHAIGDRAIDLALRALESSGTPGNPHRHRIEHFSFPRKMDVERASQLGAYVCMQPNFVANWDGPGNLYHIRLPEGTWRRSHPFRELLDDNVPLAFGSDCMPPSPLYGIGGAIDHPLTSERLTEEECLRAYTSEGARFSRMEGHLGFVRKGFIPDLAVLSQAPGSGAGTPTVLAVFHGGIQVSGARSDPSGSPT
jgi:hypothetical protein